MMGERLSNVHWQEFVENGDYTPMDQDLGKCVICKKTCECQVLESSNGEHVCLCLKCCGLENNEMQVTTSNETKPTRSTQ